jgi:hypothetical protein
MLQVERRNLKVQTMNLQTVVTVVIVINKMELECHAKKCTHYTERYTKEHPNKCKYEGVLFIGEQGNCRSYDPKPTIEKKVIASLSEDELRQFQ